MSLYQGKYRVEPTRLRDWDYRSRGWNFVTICTRNRARIFGEVVRGEMNLTALGHIVESELQNLSRALRQCSGRRPRRDAESRACSDYDRRRSRLHAESGRAGTGRAGFFVTTGRVAVCDHSLVQGWRHSPMPSNGIAGGRLAGALSTIIFFVARQSSTRFANTSETILQNGQRTRRTERRDVACNVSLCREAWPLTGTVAWRGLASRIVRACG